MKKLLFFLFLVFSSFELFAYTKDKVYKITILHTNDHHGAFWSNRDGEGGLAARATLIKKIQKEVQSQGGYTLLLDAGDVNTGPPQSNLLDARPDFLGMKLLGYDAMTVGNHEFDKSPVILKKQQKWARFPFLSANIFKKDCLHRAFLPYVIKKRGPLKIGIFGLTSEETAVQSNPLHTGQFCFLAALDVANSLVPGLRKKSDIVIALTHIGFSQNETNTPGDLTLARTVSGIDLIVGGHSHSFLETPNTEGKVGIVQVKDNGRYLGRADLEFINGQTILKKYQAISINKKQDEQKIIPDAAVLNFLRPFYEKGNATIQKEIGIAEVDFNGERESIRFQATNLGHLITSAYRQQYQADIAILNSGGIRSSLKKGKVSYEDILKVLPFGGEVVLSQIRGKELREYLNFVFTQIPVGSGGYPQVEGVEAIVDQTNKKVSELKINGKEIVNDTLYKVALPDFVANGGDHYPKLKFSKFGKIDAEVLRDYVRGKKLLLEKEFLSEKGVVRKLE